jgi:hypothetical protein
VSSQAEVVLSGARLRADEIGLAGEEAEGGLAGSQFEARSAFSEEEFIVGTSRVEPAGAHEEGEEREETFDEEATPCSILAAKALCALQGQHGGSHEGRLMRMGCTDPARRIARALRL